MKKAQKALSILSAPVIDKSTEHLTLRTLAIFDDANQVSALAEKWKNVAADKAQGHIFEQLEVTKFNLDALAKDSALYAKTTASMGLNTDPVDIVIKEGKRTLREIQAKSCNSAPASAFALSDEKYRAMLRLAPSDQHAQIEQLLKQRIAAGTLKAEEYQDTLANLTRSLQHGDVASGGTSYAEALANTDAKIAFRTAQKLKIKASITDMHKSGIKGGIVGGLIAGGVSSISELRAFSKDEQDLAATLVNVTIESGKGFATGYAVTALSKGITQAASSFMEKGMATLFTRSNAPAAIAAGVVNAGKSMISYLNGEISSEQLLDEVSHTALTGTSAFYYGAWGQVVIPIPVVGALVGATVGVVIGNLLHQSGLFALGDSSVVKAAKERRRHIEAVCLAAIPMIRQHRLEFEQLTKLHFSQRKTVFENAFLNLEQGLNELDPDRFVKGLADINEQFGKSVQFKNFKEFDDFMQSDEVFDF